MTAMTCRTDQATESAAQKEPTPRPAACDSNGRGVGIEQADCNDAGDCGKAGGRRRRSRTWRGPWKAAPDSLRSRVPYGPKDRALDGMHDLRNDLQIGAGRDWYHDDFSDCGAPVPLEDSFSDVQAYGPASNRLRYDVRLWATVDARKRPLPQIAEGFRKMAQFLEAQAARVEEIERRHLECERSGPKVRAS
jgi:hypothetical protein